MVVESLQMLAAPASTQIEYSKNGGIHHDELALELDDVRAAFLGNCEPLKPASLALGALDRQLDKMSGQAKASLWTDEALNQAQEWRIVRRLAKAALGYLDERVLSQVELEPRTRRRILLTPRDSQVYRLVLRHTVEVGNGWGKTPSPLRGFSVLDRVIHGVEDPDFNSTALQDLASGTPMTSELVKALSISLEDVTNIEFVQTFPELVDLQTTGPVHVKGSRGFIALGPIRDLVRGVEDGAFFYAGARWSRSNRYEIAQRDGTWGITKFETLMVS